MLNKINDFALPKSVTKIAETVCNATRSSSNSILRPPHLLIPIDSGNGRSSLINELTNYYQKFDAIEFSSRDHYLEFKLTGTVGNINDTHAEIQENAEYANHYRGVVAFDTDRLLPKLSDTLGDKFFEMVGKVKRYATIVIFVPVDCPKKSLDFISSKIGFRLSVLPPVEYSLNDYAKVFFDNFPFSGVDLPRNINIPRQAIADYIDRSFTRPTMRDVIELAESMAFNENEYKKLNGKFEHEIGVR